MRKPGRNLLFFLLPLFPSPRPPADPLLGALKAAGAPANLLERWKEGFAARLARARSRGVLVEPVVAPNRLCRDFQEAPFQGPALARRITGEAVRLFRPGETDLAALLEGLAFLPRRGKKALLEERHAPAPPLPGADLEGLKSLLSRLHQAWKGGVGSWKGAGRAGPALAGVTDRFLEKFYLHDGLAPAQVGPLAALLATAASGGGKRLPRAAGPLLQALLNPAWRKGLAASLAGRAPTPGKKGVTGSVLADLTLPQGRLVVGGPGPNTYDCRKIPFIVDLGGDDLYRGPAGGAFGPGRPLSLVLDLAGDDTYRAGKDAQGCGILGAGILVDAAGDDLYLGRRRCQGYALCGTGILADLGGDDVYQGREYCQGSALFGAALLLDLSGDDLYTAWVYSQGFGAPGGTGLLADGGGDDLYRADGGMASFYPEDARRGRRHSMCQGVGCGFRRLAQGGVGLLLDGGGRDLHEVGQFALAGGYYFGVGIARDLGGDDQYLVSRYGGAFAPHQAVGVLLDDGGDDIYQGRGTACLAGTWDASLAYLVDGGGNDLYSGTGITLGGAAISSFSLFLDRGGSDLYLVRGGDRTALGSGGHPRDLKFHTLSLGVFLDLGKGRDAFSFTGKVLHPRLPGRAAWWEVKLGPKGKERPAGLGLFADREE